MMPTVAPNRVKGDSSIVIAIRNVHLAEIHDGKVVSDGRTDHKDWYEGMFNDAYKFPAISYCQYPDSWGT